MSFCIQPGRASRLLGPIFAFSAALCASTAMAASLSTTLPDTPAGKLGGELIRHINADTADRIQQWAAAILSPAVAGTDKADFLKALSEQLTSKELQQFQDQLFNHAKKDALLVPNSALRWQPTRNQIRPDLRDGYFQLKGKKRAPTDTDAASRGFVWVKGDDGFVEYFEVQTGLSDSVHTEVLGVIGEGKLPEGTEIIIGEGVANRRSGGANPFVASPFKKKE